MKYIALAILIVCASTTHGQPGATTHYNINDEFMKAPNFAISNINPQLIFFPPVIRLTKKDYKNKHVIDSISNTVDLYVVDAIKQNCRYIYLKIKSGLRSQTLYFDLSPIIEKLKNNMRRQT